MIFADKLSELLEEREITRAELAEAINVSYRTVKGWFSGRQRGHRPSLQHISEICHVFDLESDYFDECFDDDYARMRYRNQNSCFTKWSGDEEEE